MFWEGVKCETIEIDEEDNKGGGLAADSTSPLVSFLASIEGFTGAAFAVTMVVSDGCLVAVEARSLPLAPPPGVAPRPPLTAEVVPVLAARCCS